MNLGLIARADQGGLGTMTWEAFRHLAPCKTLIIDLAEKGRGYSRMERYPGAYINRGMDHNLSVGLITNWLRQLDVVYTAETFYRDDFTKIARACRGPNGPAVTVLHAMPELWRADHEPPDVTWAPTSWELSRLPDGTPVVPVPVALDRLKPRLRETARRFLFVGCPAFHDRNGFDLVVNALPHVKCPITFTFAGTDKPPPIRTDRVTVEHVHPVEDYWERYDAHDVLVIPRRYGGLSLPMQEAAAAGMPVITLDLPPQNEWLPWATLVPAVPRRNVKMVNGPFTVHSADPNHIAAAIDYLASNDAECARCSQVSLDYGAALSWDVWAPRYLDLLAAFVGCVG